MASPYTISRRYPSGRKRCTFCGQYIVTENLRCGYCSHKVRGIPRTPYRRKMRDMTVVRY